ncbi:hypothetical protein [uncultured Dokdonia sp.]|uniref:hypothetical protein n=1 Tax=uncultured Dokdonia sp. TaxID=575653 RepID=UPI002628CEDC|nr:hypothetical protein [uncultured Dokdonia sp.]
MKNIKTEWLYYQSKYKYAFNKSEYDDDQYWSYMEERIVFLDHLKKCSTQELTEIMITIYIDVYPLEARGIFAKLRKGKYRDLDDIEPVSYKIDDLYNIVSYTITFKEEQSEILTMIPNVLSDKEVTIDTQDDQTIFTVVNSPIKELIVSNKIMTLNVNEDTIDIALAQQDS